MPRPEIFGMAATRKKRARKPWTLQRTIFNTFIAFIYLLSFFCAQRHFLYTFVGPARRSEFSLSAPLTKIHLPAPDPAAAAAPARERADPRPRRRPVAQPSPPRRRGLRRSRPYGRCRPGYRSEHRRQA